MAKKRYQTHTIGYRGKQMNNPKRSIQDGEKNIVSDEKIEEAVSQVIKDFSEDLIALGNE